MIIAFSFFADLLSKCIPEKEKLFQNRDKDDVSLASREKILEEPVQTSCSSEGRIFFIAI